VDRRIFLKRGLLGGVLLGAGGTIGLGVYPTELAYKPKRALRCFDERHFAVLAAIASRTVVAPAADPVEIAHRVDETLSLGVPEAKADFRNLLMLFENAAVGLLLDRRIKPFTHLGPEERDRALDAWRDSKLVLRRSGYLALKKLTLAAHYASPDTWESVGYPGPPEIAEG
jgi:gluconate 2-dehydrogenase subunit 3-like protein